MIDRRRRADATANAQRVLAAAARLLQTDPDASVDEIAAAAEVSRTTVYRHFPTRSQLVDAARDWAREQSDANESDELRPAGELAATGPSPFDVADVLNKVPPHLLGEQIVAEAQRLAGVSSVAVFLIDIDGSCLLRLAGSLEFPERIALPVAVGPELPREGLAELRESVSRQLPGSVLAPMFLRGRATGVLLAVGAPEQPLLALARQAAAALALANSYTDVFDATRRRKETSAAAEIQQNLLPPRIARISGGVLSGNVLPGYEIGGDWFDYIENRDGAWIGIADCSGDGTTAAALSSVALGAFRSKRQADGDLAETVLAIDRTIREVQFPDAYVNATIARWHGPTSTLRWITCGQHQPMVITSAGEVIEVSGHDHPSLGIGLAEPRFTADERQLTPGQRLLLVSRGVLLRRTATGEFGTVGIRAAVADVPGESAALTVRAIERAVLTANPDPLDDDATIVVFAPASQPAASLG